MFESDDRDVNVTVTMKAPDIETTREWFARAGEFPTVAYNDALEIEKLLSKAQAKPDDGRELAELVKGLRNDAGRAEMVRIALRPLSEAATISDPEGQKGRLH
ncbi:hypothetical protein ACFMPD_10550 [Sedimentitalea sp. HM32M-2]|uniref:hypothetical protein n=1 Tax=Sedimentitalea sp. HM32M-2 TaxID=3351566 RepID=UPI0036426461